jgi:hypothetical protein
MDFILVVDNEAFSTGKKVVLYFSGRSELLDKESLDKALADQCEGLKGDLEGALKDAKSALEDAPEDQQEALEKKVKFLEAYSKMVEGMIPKK